MREALRNARERGWGEGSDLASFWLMTTNESGRRPYSIGDRPLSG
jgi:hypothetical protein